MQTQRNKGRQPSHEDLILILLEDGTDLPAFWIGMQVL
jgi:hypothetical protein